jgi:hypothetical protein
MSRYYFDLHNGDGPLRDETGVEIASRTGVLQEVARIMLGIARDELPTLDRAVISVTVRDEKGEPISVSTLTFNNEWIKV